MNERIQKKETKKKVLLAAGGVIIGCVIGYVVGYKDCMAVILKKASEQVDTVEEIVEQVVEE